MEGKTELALAIAVGYLLGRCHKLRLALTLALAGATGRLGAQGNLLEQGMKLLGSSPELEKIAESVRSGLLEAGKAAAVTAASRQINSLSSRLSERAKGPLGATGLEGEPDEEDEEEEGEEAVEKPRRKTTAGPRKESASGAGKRPAAKETATRPRRRVPAEDEEPEESEPEEPRKQPARSRGTATREKASSSDRPVRRARR
ncbi:hypothetical protein [Streptosporangium sp. NPDC006007]|uniref:hypothetical protein n=1 Tax=Streptosporangium sp. NPDC006007 TaxID=3154575 RepID=UPI0033BE17D4